MRYFAIVCWMGAALLAQSCGFTPVYATKQGAAAAGFRNVNLVAVTAQPAIEPLVRRAFDNRRALADAGPAEYDLALDAEEFAQRLAVQIDASVTRYNYLLRAEYTLIRRADGKKYAGAAEAVTSFNVVNSQYSTLFAEDAAKEKAARSLIEEIERDILLRLDDEGASADEARERPEIEFDKDYSR